LGPKEGQLLNNLKVGEGARPSLTVNVDQADGLVNSASGIVTGFYPAINENENDYNPKYILVKFVDQSCGQNTRNKLKKKHVWKH